ncbi:MAG: HNH endonuclease [Acidobacteriaceae bacterium]
MIYLEMSRDAQHGGGTWGFTNCVWAPTEKKGAGGSWPFWEKVLQVHEGDTVLHLRGVPPEAYFVGYSVASGDGFRTTRRPPDPGEWSYAEAFYRADLIGFTPFHKSISLSQIFKERRSVLEAYFEANKNRGAAKDNLFFVKQSGRLQCLNGAYLSNVGEELLTLLFGSSTGLKASSSGEVIVSVETGSQISNIRTRLGQSRFSDEIKKLYGIRCSFPGCEITDPRFLVGSHIARWSDNEDLRGQLGNGLCLCLIHDKAFEVGLFTLDEHHAVFVNPRQHNSKSTVVQNLLEKEGEKIRTCRVPPLADALLEHWIRVDIDPIDSGATLTAKV